MKKKVRVYKPGGEAAQPTQEEIVNYIAQRMSSDDFDGDIDALKEELAQVGIDEVTAEQYIEYVNENLGLSDQSQTVNPEDAAAIAAEEEQAASDQEQALLDEQNAEEQARQEQMTAMYDTNIDTSADEAADDELLYMQYGGAKPNKRTFINKYTKLAKKQMGGDATNHTQGPDTKPATNFLSAVANTAKDAVLKQEAEQAYNSIYGAPQVGAFQDGGIQQEQIDTESPYDHLAKDTAARRHIFSDNMYTQNDVAAMEQYGGNTGQGLYKFIGGGDNEYIDEQYQDADLDYPQYAKQGGALHKYQEDGETTEDWKAKYDELLNQNKSQEQEKMMQQMMMQKFMEMSGSRGNNFGYNSFTPPIRRGMRYNEAVGNPYYTATGQKVDGPDFSKMTPTSVDVTKKGIFGRPKEFTVNYNGTRYNNTPEIKMPSSNSSTTTPTGTTSTASTMSTITQPSNPGAQATNSNMPYYPEPQNDQRFARRLANSGIPGIQNIGSYFVNTKSPIEKDLNNDPKEVERVRKKMPDFTPFDKVIPKAYGGPVDYTEYAYGGDISLPELYRAQAGVQVPFDPNENNMNFNNLTNYFNPEKQEGELGTLPQSMQPKTYTVDPNQVNPEEKDALSQKYKNKSEWILSGEGFKDASILAGNAVAKVLETSNTNRKQNELQSKLGSTENLYGMDTKYDKGTYDPNSGLFRPDQMGFNGVVKYGGGIYAMGGNTEDEGDDIQYMTQEEIDDFMANGGELEYL